MEDGVTRMGKGKPLYHWIVVWSRVLPVDMEWDR